MKAAMLPEHCGKEGEPDSQHGIHCVTGINMQQGLLYTLTANKPAYKANSIKVPSFMLYK